MVSAQKFKKPIVGYCIGTAAEQMKTEVQFWHAWAKANTNKEKASYKNIYMKEAGIYVPDDFGGYGEMIGEVSRMMSN